VIAVQVKVEGMEKDDHRMIAETIANLVSLIDNLSGAISCLHLQ